MTAKSSFHVARLAMALAVSTTAVAVMVSLPTGPRQMAGLSGLSPRSEVAAEDQVGLRNRAPNRIEQNPTTRRIVEGSTGDALDTPVTRRTTPTPLDEPTRVASRGDAPVLTDVPRRPSPETGSPAPERLPPEPREPEPPARNASRTDSPRIELGPIDDADRSAESLSRKLNEALSIRSSGEPWINVQLVVQGEPRSSTPEPSETTTKLEERLTRLEDRLTDLARREDDQRAGYLAETARRVESMQQSMQLRALEQQVQQLKDRVKARGSKPAAAPQRAAVDSAGPPEAQPTASASIAARVAIPEIVPNGMPQIRPGPPYYRPGTPQNDDAARDESFTPVPAIPRTAAAVAPSERSDGRASEAAASVHSRTSEPPPDADEPTARSRAESPTSGTGPSIRPLLPEAPPLSPIESSPMPKADQASPAPPPPSAVDFPAPIESSRSSAPHAPPPIPVGLGADSAGGAERPVAVGFALHPPRDDASPPSADIAWDAPPIPLPALNAPAMPPARSHRPTPQHPQVGAFAPLEASPIGDNQPRPAGNLLAFLKGRRHAAPAAATPYVVQRQPTPVLQSVPTSQPARPTATLAPRPGETASGPAIQPVGSENPNGFPGTVLQAGGAPPTPPAAGVGPGAVEYRTARDHLARGELEPALAHARRAIELQPNLREAHALSHQIERAIRERGGP